MKLIPINTTAIIFSKYNELCNPKMVLEGLGYN